MKEKKIPSISQRYTYNDLSISDQIMDIEPLSTSMDYCEESNKNLYHYGSIQFYLSNTFRGRAYSIKSVDNVWLSLKSRTKPTIPISQSEGVIFYE